MSMLKYPYTNLHELNLDWIIEQLNREGAVLSVNGKHGTVTLTAEDIARTSLNQQTVEQALSSQGSSIQSVQTKIGVTTLPTTAQTITGAIAEHETDITGINNKIGNTALPTTAQTLTGAAAELDGDVTTINNKIGNTALPTTAQTLSGAIAELNSDLFTVTTLHSGGLNVDDEATLTEPITNFQFVLLLFASNYEMKTQIIPTSIATSRNIAESLFADNSSGLITYPPAYNSSTIVSFIATNKIKCTQLIYSNANYTCRLTNVYGVIRK